jgi:hypothetical protein
MIQIENIVMQNRGEAASKTKMFEKLNRMEIRNM